MFSHASTSKNEPKEKEIEMSDEPKKDIKVEKVSPTKQSPKKKETPKKKESNNTKPAPKNSIASFFAKGAAKPPISKPLSSNSLPEETKTQSDPTSATQSMKESIAGTSKRQASQEVKLESEEDDAISSTPKEALKKPARPSKKFKPAKKFTQSGKKHSRIMQLDESSDENDDDKPVEEEKQIEFDHEDEPVEDIKAQKSPLKESPLKKRKGRRQVNRTYMDDEGFVVTLKEFEEYSLSEDDEPQLKKSKQEVSSPTNLVKPEEEAKVEKNFKAENFKADGKSKGKKSKTEDSSTAKQPSKIKQGSLLSFFSKK